MGVLEFVAKSCIYREPEMLKLVQTSFIQNSVEILLRQGFKTRARVEVVGRRHVQSYLYLNNQASEGEDSSDLDDVVDKRLAALLLEDDVKTISEYLAHIACA